MDRVFRAARIWSNNQLRKYATDFYGDVVNVSAWEDKDKEGGTYQSYFKNATSYSITNLGKGGMGKSAGIKGISEYELDLTETLDENMKRKFDVVFNHTTLEHIYDIRMAFKNLCQLSKEAVIIVVPWLQRVHASKDVYDDYWRCSPYALQRLFEENGYALVVCTYNNTRDVSVYLFCIGIRKEKMSSYPQYHSLDVTTMTPPPGAWVGTPTVWEVIRNKVRCVFKLDNRG